MSAPVMHRVTVKKHSCGRTWTATCSACPWEWPSAWWWKSLLWATRHADEHRTNGLSMTNTRPAGVQGAPAGAIGGARAISDATPIPPREFVADGTSGSRGAPTLGCRDANSF